MRIGGLTLCDVTSRRRQSLCIARSRAQRRGQVDVNERSYPRIDSGFELYRRVGAVSTAASSIIDSLRVFCLRLGSRLFTDNVTVAIYNHQFFPTDAFIHSDTNKAVLCHGLGFDPTHEKAGPLMTPKTVDGTRRGDQLYSTDACYHVW